MKKYILILVTAIFVVMLQNVQAQQQVNVGIILTDDVDEDSHKAENESAVVSDDVMKDGKIVIAAGTPVILDVEYQKHRGVGKQGYISVKPVSTMDVYGQIVSLNGAAKTFEGKSRRGAAIGCGVFFGIVTFPVGLLFLCIKGQDAELEEGTKMVATATLN